MTGAPPGRLRRTLGPADRTQPVPAPPITVHWKDTVEAPALRWPSARAADVTARPVEAGLDVTVEGAPITGELVLVDEEGRQKRLGQRLTPGWLRVTAWCEAPLDGEVSLVVSALGETAERLGRVSMPLGTEPRDWLIEAPEGVRRTVLAVRLGGSARIGGVRVEMAAAGRGALPEAGDWVDRTADLAGHVRDLMARRDYEAVLALQAQPTFQVETVNRAALGALVELRRFDEALAHQERFGPKDDPGTEQRVLEALGNLGRWDEVRARIRRTLKREPVEVRTPLLLRSFAFADPALRRQVLARLVRTPEAVPAGDRAALDVANGMAFERRTPGGRRFIAAVRGDEALPAIQRDLLAGQLALATGDRTGQWAAANRALAHHDLEPLIPPVPLARMAVERLACAAPAGSVEGPRVTAIMTSFNSAATIAHALRSLAGQTHRPLDIILVDDASQDDTVARAQAAIEAHPTVRLTVLRQTENIGTYACRNLALAEASGDYVFNQDSDDWAHPRKVERLLQAASAPGRIAAFSQALRLSPDRGFVSRRGFLAPDTSILFERAPVLKALQGYDPVRAGADGEFHRRMELVFGVDAIAVIEEPLSIIAARAQSLSRSGAFAIDEETGVFSPERNAYRRAYLERHAVLRAEISRDAGSR